MGCKGVCKKLVFHLFRLCLSRKPDAAERDRLATFFEQQKKMLGTGEAALVGVSRAVMNLDEFITRE